MPLKALSSRLGRLERSAPRGPCAACNGKSRVVYVTGPGGERIADADTSPCAGCGLPPITVAYVNWLSPEARERQADMLAQRAALDK